MSKFQSEMEYIINLEKTKDDIADDIADCRPPARLVECDGLGQGARRMSERASERNL